MPSKFQDVQEDSNVTGFVRNITPAGLFVEFLGGLTGLVPKRLIEDANLTQPQFGFSKGSTITVRVHEVDADLQRFILSQKAATSATSAGTSSKKTKEKLQTDDVLANSIDEEIKTMSDISFGRIVKCKVVSVKATQINVQLADNIQGRIDVSEIFDKWEDLKDRKLAGQNGDSTSGDRQRAQGSKSADRSKTAEKTRQLIAEAQQMLKGKVIRRTARSPDYTGKVIWDATLPHEKTMYLKCNPSERQALEQLADSSSKTNLLGFENVSARPSSNVGSRLCGHPGIIHGGMLATILDEGLARACFPAFVSKTGVTASLKIDYKTLCPANSFIVLRAWTTKVERRKAWCSGRLELLLDEDHTQEVILAEAEGLFIEPKNAHQLSKMNEWFVN